MQPIKICRRVKVNGQFCFTKTRAVVENSLRIHAKEWHTPLSLQISKWLNERLPGVWNQSNRLGLPTAAVSSGDCAKNRLSQIPLPTNNATGNTSLRVGDAQNLCHCPKYCIWLERVCIQTQLCQLRSFNDYTRQLHVSASTGHHQVVFKRT